MIIFNYIKLAIGSFTRFELKSWSVRICLEPEGFTWLNKGLFIVNLFYDMLKFVNYYKEEIELNYNDLSRSLTFFLRQ